MVKSKPQHPCAFLQHQLWSSPQVASHILLSITNGVPLYAKCGRTHTHTHLCPAMYAESQCVDPGLRLSCLSAPSSISSFSRMPTAEEPRSPWEPASTGSC